MTIRQNIPAIEGVKDDRVATILSPVKIILEMITGRTPNRPLIKTLGTDCTIDGVANKVNEIIDRLQDTQSHAKAKVLQTATVISTSTGTGSGTVTSVSETLAKDFTETIAGVPITTNGTIARTAVNPGFNAVVGFSTASDSKRYFAIGPGLTLTVGGTSTLSATGTGTGSVVSVSESLSKDLTENIGGSPITGAGTLTRTAVDPGFMALQGWSTASAAKIYFGIGNGLTISNGTLSATGTGTGSVTSVGETLAKDFTETIAGSPVTGAGTLSRTAVDPGADSLQGWSTASGGKVYFGIGAGLVLSGGTLSSTASGGAGNGPAPPQNAVQYFAGTGTFGGDADFTWDPTNNILTFGNFDTAATITTTTASGVNGAGLTITAGRAAAGHDGGSIIIVGGPGATNSPTSNGGSVTIKGGTGGASATGAQAGHVFITGGVTGGTAAGGGGNVTIAAGDSTANAGGGAISLTAGRGGSAQAGGDVTIQSGPGGSANSCGTVQLTGAQATATNSVGGAITGLGGESTANNQGGLVTFRGGKGGPTSGLGGHFLATGGQGGAVAGNGGNSTIQGGPSGGTGTGGKARVLGGIPNDGPGGDVDVAAWQGAGTNRNGGNVNISAGVASGTGIPGNIYFDGGGGFELTTAARGGFICIPTINGSATAVPVVASTATGMVALYFNRSTNQIMVYNGGWVGVGLS